MADSILMSWVIPIAFFLFVFITLLSILNKTKVFGGGGIDFVVSLIISFILTFAIFSVF